MNLRKWSRFHTLGLIVGFVGPLLYIPVTIFVMSQLQNSYFQIYWNIFWEQTATQGKFVSLSIIPNLIWFYVFLNKEKYNFAMGIILGSALYLPYILYINFF